MNKNKKVRDINEYKKRKKNKNKKRKNKNKLKYISISFLVLIISIINLIGNAKVSNLKYDINKKKQELRNEEIALDELKMEKIKHGSRTSVEKEAKEKLGMNYPNKHQIRYIDMEN